jgi:CheY-like chemotaxis protein
LAKILTIEDEANVRTLTGMLLTRLGYEVLLADNGWKGLELYRREHPEVVVLDLTLPGMHGLEVLKQIGASVHSLGDTLKRLLKALVPVPSTSAS